MTGAMADATTPSLPLHTRLNHYFQHRTERERRAFERVRRVLSLPTILRRQTAARAMASEARFTIDRERGFVMFPPGAFPEAVEIAEVTRALGQNVDLSRPGLSKKARSGFMVPMLDPASLDLTSPLLRLAIRPDVIAAVSAYLGIVPVIAHLNVYYSEANSDEARSSQLFHCDADATTQMKIFVLCSEVTRAHGPLTLVEAGKSRALREQLGYHFGGKVKDKSLSKKVKPEDLHPVLGPPGTTCFVDTTQCFHFGSRVEAGAGPRLVTMIQYLAPSSFMLPRDHRAGSPFRRLSTADQSVAQQLVLGGI